MISFMYKNQFLEFQNVECIIFNFPFWIDRRNENNCWTLKRRRGTEV